MVTNAQNKCPFIITRGRNRVCNKNCIKKYCSVHAKLLRDRNHEIRYSFCQYCSKINRSKYGVCFVCYIARNVRYHTLKAGNN